MTEQKVTCVTTSNANSQVTCWVGAYDKPIVKCMLDGYDPNKELLVNNIEENR